MKKLRETASITMDIVMDAGSKMANTNICDDTF